MEPWILSIIILASGILIGALLEFILLDRFRKIAERTKWEGDEVILRSMRGLTLAWFSLIGAYFSILNAPLSDLIVEQGKKVIIIALIFTTTVFLSKLIVGFVRVYTEKISGKVPVTSIFSNITRFIVFAIGLLVILQSLGISITPILTALGVGGLAVALALQDTLSNLFAGFHILASKSIRPGDYVKLQTGEEGYITDINWRVTSIKAPDHLIVIPNSKVSTSILLNYYLPEEKIILKVPVFVSHTADLKKVEEISLAAAKEIIGSIEGCSTEDEPAVRFTNFGENGIHFNLLLKVKEYDLQFRIRSELIKRLHQRYKENGIEISYPSRNVYMKNP
jgi:small-conductance mechanosensitive channel